jgi:hypothetical protein
MEKRAGYTLLIIGILIILFALLNVYLMFSKQIESIKFFDFPAVSIDAMSMLAGDLTAEQKQLAQSQLGNTKVDIIPAKILNDSSNMFAHLVFMSFVASIGAKFATIGVGLIRPIKVSGLKE